MFIMFLHVNHNCEKRFISYLGEWVHTLGLREMTEVLCDSKFLAFCPLDLFHLLLLIIFLLILIF